MTSICRRRTGAPAVIFLMGLTASLLSMSGCRKPPAVVDAPTAHDTGDGVFLNPDEVEKIGIVVTPAADATHVPESAGFGVVTGHDAVAQALADWVSAAAVARQSQAALARTARLAGTPGAMPVEVQENADRQAEVDQAALRLTRQHLTSNFGQSPPWKGDPHSSVLQALASGEIKLVRVTFPLGSIGEELPNAIRLARLGIGDPEKSWTSSALWSAPSDASIPGRSFFALLRGSDAREGERLQIWSPVGAAESGVVVPAAAVIIRNGEYWCYVERRPGHFVRTELDTSMPVNGGYFLKQGIVPGEKLVTHGAGLLLARETNPGTAAE